MNVVNLHVVGRIGQVGLELPGHELGFMPGHELGKLSNLVRRKDAQRHIEDVLEKKKHAFLFE